MNITRLTNEIASNRQKSSQIRIFASTGSEITDDSDVSFHFPASKQTCILFFTTNNKNFESKWLTELYEKTVKLGEGGFGVVHLAKNKHTGELVAMKVFKHSISQLLSRSLLKS